MIDFKEYLEDLLGRPVSDDECDEIFDKIMVNMEQKPVSKIEVKKCPIREKNEFAQKPP